LFSTGTYWELNAEFQTLRSIVFIGFYYELYTTFVFLFRRNSTLDTEILDYKNDGAYDVTVSSLFSESELPSRTVFFCQVIIPGTPYNITKRFIYNSGKSFIRVLAKKIIKKKKTILFTMYILCKAVNINALTVNPFDKYIVKNNRMSRHVFVSECLFRYEIRLDKMATLWHIESNSVRQSVTFTRCRTVDRENDNNVSAYENVRTASECN